MLGFSIFLNDELSEDKITYIHKMKSMNFQGIFSSIHIPEDNSENYIERLKTLGTLCKKLDLRLMVDISDAALTQIGLSFDRPKEIMDMGITGLRMDYGIGNQEIANLSHHMTIGLNASTFTIADANELKKYNGNFSNMEMWHNYYPRENTGLGKGSFITKNSWLKELGFTTMAFVPGNFKLRGPLYQSLPTLEKHRMGNPLACALELMNDCSIDIVYVGDPEITDFSAQQINNYFATGNLLLSAININPSYSDLIIKKHMNRLDGAQDVMRSATARFDLGSRVIAKENCIKRSIGSITLDNEKYGRYMGEFQITKIDLDADNRVNVVGNIVESDIDLLSFITDGTVIDLLETPNRRGEL